MSDRVTVGERYARASISSNLKVQTHTQQSDVDKVHAAGCVQAGSERKMIGLRLYRLQTTGDRASLSLIFRFSRAALQFRLSRKGNRPLPGAHLDTLVTRTLQWWISQQCEFCGGTGFDTVENAPALSLKECSACNGTRITPLKRVIPNHLLSHADWLTKEWDGMCADVIGEMARKLSLDLK